MLVRSKVLDRADIVREAIYQQPAPLWEYCGEGKAFMKEGKFFSHPISTGTDFLRAELRVGLTRTAIAQKASTESKRERNRIEARKAYDSVLRFLPEATLSPEEKKEIDLKLVELRFSLQSLGESV